MRALRRTARRCLTILAAISVAAFVFAASALAAADILLTFVRHAQSQANADGIINTEVPGPHITELGEQEAAALAAALADGGYDGLYASDMVRTQDTAAPLAAILDLPVTVLAGLHEIDAGIYEGSSETGGLGRLGYGLAPLLWTLGVRSAWIPGSSDANGNIFSDRMSEAVKIIYEDGYAQPVAFSHGATIMFWTMMNVDNPDLGLLLSHQLPNTGVVVLEGNPEDGWTLISWDGIAVDPEPSFLTKTFVNVREFVTTPQTAVYNLKKAFSTGDLSTISQSFAQAVIDVVLAPVKLIAAVATDVIDLVLSPAQTVEPEATVESITSRAAVSSDVVEQVTSPAPPAVLDRPARASKRTGDSVRSERPSEDSRDEQTEPDEPTEKSEDLEVSVPRADRFDVAPDSRSDDGDTDYVTPDAADDTDSRDATTDTAAQRRGAGASEKEAA